MVRSQIEIQPGEISLALSNRRLQVGMFGYLKSSRRRFRHQMTTEPL